MARDVRFAFEPPLASTMDDRRDDLPAVAELPVIRDGIPSLPPGKEIRLLFDHSIQRKKSELPDQYVVTIEYDGDEIPRLVRRPRREHFTDTTRLDLSIYWGLTYINRYGEHEIHERLKEICDVLKKWSPASGRGLLAITPDDVRGRDEEWLEQVREREREREQD